MNLGLRREDLDSLERPARLDPSVVERVLRSQRRVSVLVLVAVASEAVALELAADQSELVSHASLRVLEGHLELDALFEKLLLDILALLELRYVFDEAQVHARDQVRLDLFKSEEHVNVLNVVFGELPEQALALHFPVVEVLPRGDDGGC